MEELHPIVGFARGIQHSLIPEEKRSQENLKPSIAFACTQFISDLTQHKEDESIINWLLKEVGARVGALAMPFFVSLSVLQLGGAFVCHLSLMTLTWDWDFDLLYEDLVQTGLMAIDIFAQIVVCPISIVAPSVYTLTPCVKHPQEHEIIPLREKIARLEEQLVNASSLSQLPSGVTSKRYTYERPSYSPTWGNINQTPFIELQQPAIRPLENVEKFLCPQGTLELEIDFRVQTNQQLIQALLNTPHSVDRLVLSHPPSIDFLMEISSEATLSKIHTLVICHCETLRKETLDAIAAKFPNIACFEFRECTIDQPLNELTQNHILVFLSSSGEQQDNIQEKYAELNAKLFSIVKTYYQGLVQHFPVLNERRLFHPAAPFIENVSFLTGLPITDSHLTPLIPRLPYSFRNMKVLSLSGCKELSFDTLFALPECHAKEIFLAYCPKLLPERMVGNGMGFEQQNVQEAFVTAVKQLYTSGVEFIRFDHSGGLKEPIEGSVLPWIDQQTGKKEIIYHNGDGIVLYPED